VGKTHSGLEHCSRVKERKYEEIIGSFGSGCV
jgi:hypothetical protein